MANAIQITDMTLGSNVNVTYNKTRTPLSFFDGGCSYLVYWCLLGVDNNRS